MRDAGRQTKTQRDREAGNGLTRASSTSSPHAELTASALSPPRLRFALGKHGTSSHAREHPPIGSAPIEVEPPAGCAEDRAAGLVDVAHDAQVEVPPVVRVEALVAVLDAVDALDLVRAVEGRRDLADDVVEAGAEAAASDDGGHHLGDVELDHLARAGAQPLVILNAVLNRRFGMNVYDINQSLVGPYKILIAWPGTEKQRAGIVFCFSQILQQCHYHRCNSDFLNEFDLSS